MLVLVGTHFVPSGTYFCIFIEHKTKWIFKTNELKIEKNLTLPRFLLKKLKMALVSILKHPDCSKKIIINTDASGFALGAF